MSTTSAQTPGRDDQGRRIRRQADPAGPPRHRGGQDLGPLFSTPAYRGGSIDARFMTWIEENPHVLRRFVTIALQLRAKGHQRVSAKMICETLRCEAMMATRGDVFKINNDFSSRLARLAMATEPRLADMFETRRLRSREA